MYVVCNPIEIIECQSDQSIVSNTIDEVLDVVSNEISFILNQLKKSYARMKKKKGLWMNSIIDQ